jgi:cytochrome c-type biogenesis protein CcmH/NrfG
VFRREFEEEPRYILFREVMHDEASSPESRRTLMEDLTDLSQSVKSPEFNAGAWLRLGNHLIDWVGDKDTAKAAYRQAIKRGEQCAQADGPLKSQDPELDPAFYARLGDRLADLGVWEDSERAYELAIRLDGRHSQ